MLTDFPDDILLVIFNLCDNQSQLTLLGTCNKLLNLYTPQLIKKNKALFNVDFLCGNSVEMYEYFKKWLMHDADFYYFLALSKDNNVIKHIASNIDTENQKMLWEGASSIGNLDLLIWMNSYYEKKYYGILFKYACKYGHINILDHFNSRKLRTSYQLDYSNLAAENGHLHVLKWLDNNILRLHNDVYHYIMDDNRLNIWKWLQESNNLMDISRENKLCKHAAINKCYKVLKWLVKNDCHIDFETVSFCIQNNNYDIFEWLLKRVPDLKYDINQPYIHNSILNAKDSRFQDWYLHNV